MKGYWISLYLNIESKKNLKKYSKAVVPIIKSFGGKPIVRGGRYKKYEGEDFNRTVIWEFPSYEKAIECHDSKDYQDGKISEAEFPNICTPKTSSVSLSASIFTKPTESPAASALPLAENGKLPFL